MWALTGHGDPLLPGRNGPRAPGEVQPDTSSAEEGGGPQRGRCRHYGRYVSKTDVVIMAGRCHRQMRHHGR